MVSWGQPKLEGNDRKLLAAEEGIGLGGSTGPYNLRCCGIHSLVFI